MSACQCAWVSVTILSAALASPGVVDRSSFFDLPECIPDVHVQTTKGGSTRKEKQTQTSYPSTVLRTSTDYRLLLGRTSNIPSVVL